MTGILSLILILIAVPAHAAVIGAALSAIGGIAVGTTTVGAIVGRLALSLAISAYQKRKMKKKMAAQQSGITTQFLGEGGVTPLTLIVGRYATNGHLEAPQMSQPDAGSPPNRFLTYVISLGDLPITGLTGRIVINDDWHTLSDTPWPGYADYGQTVEGALAGYCFFRFYDGTQTAADPFLIANFGSAAERPWLADMIGRGIPYVVATFVRDQERFPGEPRLRFEVDGTKFYDPRRDTTVGGSGAHRWADRSTWEFTQNPKVIEYNIRRGIEIDGHGVWGGGWQAADLPLDNWFAAMNACDLLVDDGDGGTEPAFQFGLEFGLDTEPRTVIDEINRSCTGESVDLGGICKTRVGGVGLPVYFFTDGDVLVTRPQELEPFNGLDDTFNAISCSFPDPALLWESREAPPLTNATWEEEDGQLEFDEALGTWAVRPRRLLQALTLPGVSNVRQVQRVLSSLANRARRGRNHVVNLPPDAAGIEVLDAVAWTSDRNGYDAELFEVVLAADAVTALRPRLGLLQADPSDDDPPAYVALPAPSGRNPAFGTRTVVGFDAADINLRDATGGARRTGAELTWDGPAMADCRGIRWEVRVAPSLALPTGELVAEGETLDPETGRAVVSNLLPTTAYQARAIAVTDRATVWTDWVDFTTATVRFSRSDLAPTAVSKRFGVPAENVGGATLTDATTSYVTVRSIAISDQDGPAGTQMASVTVGVELVAPAPRWIMLRLMLSHFGGPTAALDQPVLIRPGGPLLYTITGPANTPSGVLGLTASVQQLDLLPGETLTVGKVGMWAHATYI